MIVEHLWSNIVPARVVGGMLKQTWMVVIKSSFSGRDHIIAMHVATENSFTENRSHNCNLYKRFEQSYK